MASAPLEKGIRPSKDERHFIFAAEENCYIPQGREFDQIETFPGPVQGARRGFLT
jgi:hypothetical protein